jgi:catalase
LSFLFGQSRRSSAGSSQDTWRFNPPVTTQVVDLANKLSGVHPGFRAFHAKGAVVEGSFKASPEAARLSRAPLFSGHCLHHRRLRAVK